MNTGRGGTGGRTTSGDVMRNEAETLKRSEINMVAQAIRRGWAIPQDIMSTLPARVARTLAEAEADGNGDLVAKIAGLLRLMHADNMKDAQHLEKLEQADRHHQDKMGDTRPISVRIVEGDDD